MTLLWLSALSLLFLAPSVGFLWLRRTQAPGYRLAHGKLLATDKLPHDAQCGVCQRPQNAALVVRSKGLPDMPVCGYCAFPPVAVTPDIRMRQPLRRISLDEPDPPAKSMPRFDQ